MARLKDLKPGLKVKGVVPEQMVSVVEVKWHGSGTVELFYKRADGQPDHQLLYRHDEVTLAVIEAKRTCRFDTDGHTFRQVAEANRIHLAHLR